MQVVTASQVLEAIRDECILHEGDDRPMKVGHDFREEVMRSRRRGESLGQASRRVYRRRAEA
jgi:hypothetical protein